MLGCLGHDMTISLISPQHQLMWVTCMHKCNSHVQLIQSNVPLSLSPSLSSPFNRSQCLKLIIAIVFDASFRTPFVPSFHFVQSTSSYINVDLDSEATGIVKEWHGLGLGSTEYVCLGTCLACCCFAVSRDL